MVRSILITGASSGIGRATAEHFLAKGWMVGLLARRGDLLAEIAAGRERAVVLTGDVTDPDGVDAAFDRFTDTAGRLDVLFNNAGISYPSTLIDEIPVDVWRSMVDINLTGSFLCARAAFRQMRNQTPQGGRIINNGSISAYAPRPGTVPYTATKHAITGLTRTLALDGRPFDIACGQIDIGNAGTNMTTAMQKGVPQANGTLEVEPVMDVQNVGDAVLHMASLPLSANILFMNVMATKMPFVGRG